MRSVLDTYLPINIDQVDDMLENWQEVVEITADQGNIIPKVRVGSSVVGAASGFGGIIATDASPASSTPTAWELCIPNRLPASESIISSPGRSAGGSIIVIS